MNRINGTAWFVVYVGLLVFTCPSQSEIVWTDYLENPLAMPMPNGDRSYMPNVIWNPDLQRYQCWYEQGSIDLVTYAESDDGITWSNETLTQGITIDDLQVGRGFMLYNTEWEYPYKAYFFGRGGDLGDHVRFAESIDGIVWENNQPLDMSDATVSGQTISSPDGHAVLFDPDFPGEPYRMYLKTGDQTSIMQSSDGITWTWFDFATLDEGFHITAILQISENDYRAWGFRDYSVAGIQYFRSADGIEFELIQDPVEVIGGAGPAESWNGDRNYHPSVVYEGNGQFKMWRSGKHDVTGAYRMGFATGIDTDLGTLVDQWSIF